MHASTVEAAVAIVMGTLALGGAAWRAGKLVSILEELKEITGDHETRLRDLEDGRRLQARRHR